MPGGTRRNLAFVDDRLDRAGVGDLTVMLLADAQTSGGLLFGVDAERADESVVRLARTDHEAAIVGEVHEGTGQLRLRP